MKDRENIERLFTSAGCLTLETMKKHLASSLSPKEKNQVDKHLEDCELCKDALDGFLLVSSPDKIDSIVSEINENLRSNLPTEETTKKIRSQNRFYYIAAAASVIIFIGIFSYFKFYIQDQNLELSVINEKTETDKKENFKSVAEESKFEVMEKEETEQMIPTGPEEKGGRSIQDPSEDQDDVPTKDIETVVEITMKETTVPASEEKDIVQAMTDVVVEQPSAIGGIEEPTENVMDGITLNGKGQDTERLSFEEEVEGDEEQFNSKALGKRQSAGKKDRSKFADESISSNLVYADSLDYEEPQVYSVVEKQPEFPGGSDSLDTFLQQNLVYPDSAREAEIQGRVYVSFTIKKSGKIKDAKVLRGIGGGCDEVALQLVISMPDWIPGEQRGKPVDVKMVLPVTFRLTN